MTLSGFRLKRKEDSKDQKLSALFVISKVVYFPYFLIIESEKVQNRAKSQRIQSKKGEQKCTPQEGPQALADNL